MARWLYIVAGLILALAFGLRNRLQRIWAKRNGTSPMDRYQKQLSARMGVVGFIKHQLNPHTLFSFVKHVVSAIGARKGACLCVCWVCCAAIGV